MKRFLYLTILAVMLFLLISCAGSGTKTVHTPQQKTPVPDGSRPPESSNPISGPIQNSNLESAESDARNCLSVLVMSLAEEGVGTLDNGIIFVVTKSSGVYNFVYSDGDLTYVVGEPAKGVEITPQSSDWLSNVRAYMP